MHRPWFAWCLLLVVALSCACAGAAQSAPAAINPGAVWLDIQGHEIEAHGGGVIRFHRQFYWVGEDRTQGLDPTKRYVSCYTSSDLAHWNHHKDALVLEDPEHLGPRWVVERPKIYAPAHGGPFVMYFHLDDSHYKVARVGVAVSRKPCGPYRYVRSFRPLAQESRDIGQFVDDDGTAYLIFESRPTKGFFLAKLSADHLEVAGKASFVPAPLEGGALVHVGNWYYVIGSHMTGWQPNPDVYAVSHDIAGPWSAFRNMAPPEKNTYDSQPTMLLKVVGTKATAVLYMGDIWKPKAQWDSRYLWMPLTLGGGTLALPPPAPWTIDVKTGETHVH